MIAKSKQRAAAVTLSATCLICAAFFFLIKEEPFKPKFREDAQSSEFTNKAIFAHINGKINLINQTPYYRKGSPFESGGIYLNVNEMAKSKLVLIYALTDGIYIEGGLLLKIETEKTPHELSRMTLTIAENGMPVFQAP